MTITFPANGADYNADGWAAGCVTNDVCGTAADAGGRRERDRHDPAQQ